MPKVSAIVFCCAVCWVGLLGLVWWAVFLVDCELFLSARIGRFSNFWVAFGWPFSVLMMPFFAVLLYSIHGEFDSGSGRTLAACLTHASRATPAFRGGDGAANG